MNCYILPVPCTRTVSHIKQEINNINSNAMFFT